MRKWHHGHSIATGMLLGLSLAAHAWIFVAIGVLVGFVARDLWAIRGRVIRWANRPRVIRDMRRVW